MLLFAMRLLLVLAAATAATAEYVPGKAFDRFFTIWLENQVCARSVFIGRGAGPDVKLGFQRGR
jgi:hypothetical protein